MDMMSLRRIVIEASVKIPSIFVSKYGLVQIKTFHNGAAMYEYADTVSNTAVSSFRFITLGANVGKYQAYGASLEAATVGYAGLYPYPIPNGAKTITVRCGVNFAPLIVYYDKNTLADYGSTDKYADSAKVVDGQTASANTNWSIGSWVYGDKTYTIPEGINANSFTIGFNTKTKTIFDNLDVNNSGITIEFGY